MHWFEEPLSYSARFSFDEDYEDDPSARSKKGPNVTQKHSMILLAKCLNAFPQESSPFYPALKKAIIDKVTSNEIYSMKNMAFEFLKEEDASLKACPLVREMFEERKKQLDDIIKNFSVFSWRMPYAQIEGHPRVQEFLRSDLQEMEYQIADPSDLAGFIYTCNCSWMQDTFSVQVSKKSAKVALIKKTKRWYQKQLENRKNHLAEFLYVSAYLSNKK